MEQSNDKFREIFEKSPIGIIFFDKEGKLTDVNLSTLKIMGYPSLNDIIGLNIFNDPYITPKKDELLEKGHIKIQSPVDFDNIKRAGIYNPTRSGTAFIDLTISIIDSGFLAQIQDITERKKAEEQIQFERNRLETILDTSPAAIIIVDADGKLSYINTRARQLYGVDISGLDLAEAVTKVKAKRIDGSEYSPGESPTGRALKGQEVHNEEVIMEQPDGTIIPILASAAPIINSEGEIIAAVAIFEDITELKKSEEQIQELLEETRRFAEELQVSNEELKSTTEELHTSNEELHTTTEELRLVNEELKESEEKFAVAFANNPAAVAITRLEDGIYIEVNNTFLSMLGYSRDEIIGRSARKLGVWPNVESQNRFVNELRKKGIIRDWEEEFFKKSGEIFITQLSAQVLTINEEKVILSTIIDITERKEAEYALMDSEARFRSLYENSFDAILLTQPDGRILAANLAAQKMFSMTENEIIKAGRTGLIVPDEKLKHALKVRKEKGIVTSELTARRNDGSLFPIELTSSIFKDADGILKTSMIIRDVTERKNAEEELKEREHLYHSVFDNTDDGFQLVELIYDNSGKVDDFKFLRVNAAYERHVGINADFVIGKTAKELAPNLERYWFDTYSKVDRTGKPTHIEEYNVDTKRWYNSYIFSYADGVIGNLFTDITERKQAEEELKNALTELKRSNKELQSFAYITSHDLQEPLRTVASFAQLLQRRYEGQLDSDADEFLEYMVSGATRMRDMIQGLLDYSRVGTQEGEFTEFNSDEAVNNALSNLHSAIEECHAEVTYDKLPIIIADKSQIIRVFQNFIGNALKFRKKGVKPEIHISCRKEDNEYIFSVSDNGIGLEEQYSDKIFEVFKRLHAIGEYQGAGIGLAIVKRIIDRHRGRVWVESSLGKGSTFYFTIPIKNE